MDQARKKGIDKGEGRAYNIYCCREKGAREAPTRLAILENDIGKNGKEQSDSERVKRLEELERRALASPKGERVEDKD